ncbi:MAG: TRAP transporter small permease [Deltaproteobacteria bacterium]|nr:TRAP transporter small permease [Deltaproteobacteria bacterium]
MRRVGSFIYKIDLTFEWVAGIVLALMMVTTVVDVLTRLFGHPIVGTIEIITFSGAIVVGFALPASSWKRSHIYVDILVDKLPSGPRKAMNCVTKIMGILLFLFISYNFIVYGQALKQSGEVSPAFGIPYYPLTYGLALSCLLQSLTLFFDMLRMLSEESSVRETVNE